MTSTEASVSTKYTTRVSVVASDANLRKNL
ncbi:hypothetical protein BSF40_50700 [Pseudomonas sp. ACN5]|nr:hypothetical protein BSF40_50700 [Pseudomonas sp. ACN5]